MEAAIKSGNAKEFADLMKQDPGFKVNMDQDGKGSTLLHYACGGNDGSQGQFEGDRQWGIHPTVAC